MIVYLPHGAFGASKMVKGKYISQEFPVGDSVSPALQNAIAWEKRGKKVGAVKREPKVRGPRKPKVTRQVSEPKYITEDGVRRVVVEYIDKDGRRSRVKRNLPEVGEERMVQSAINLARVMAGVSPDAGLRSRALPLR